MIWLVFFVGALVVAMVVTQLGRWTVPDDEPMGRFARFVLVVYLLALSVGLVYCLIKLSALDYPDAPLTIEAPRDQDVTALSKVPGPALFYVMAHLTPGSPATYELALYGTRFQKDARVNLNGHEHVPKSLNGDNLLRVVPENKVLIGTNALVAEVVNPDGGRSNALTLRIDRPRMPLALFGKSWSITREVQLLLMVLCAGALGTFVHAIGSLGNFIGARKTESSWFWWYVTRPFLGSTMALVFYAVLRGGFLTGTPADVGVVNPFGAMAVAALVGMFADKAALKLREVFDTLFKADDPRTGKLGPIDGPIIDKLVPSTVRAGAGHPIAVKIVGDRLGRATAVKVNRVERKADEVQEKEIVLELTPEDTKHVKELKISVVTPEGTSHAATLWVSDLEITTATLPAGKVGTDYAGQLTATGGTEPQWSLQNAPDGLEIDPKSGAVTGRPAKAGSTKATVTVTDKNGAAVTREYDLQITP